jgi:transcription elongation factor Elf1
MPFTCTICGEESTRICVWCTKDTCANHLCAKCGRCSDCCECEVPLDEPMHYGPAGT